MKRKVQSRTRNTPETDDVKIVFSTFFWREGGIGGNCSLAPPLSTAMMFLTFPFTLVLQIISIIATLYTLDMSQYL